MTDYARIPGPGDPETWGPYTGHPLDPRADDSAREKAVEDLCEQVESDPNELAEALGVFGGELNTVAHEINLIALLGAQTDQQKLQAVEVLTDHLQQVIGWYAERQVDRNPCDYYPDPDDINA